MNKWVILVLAIILSSCSIQKSGGEEKNASKPDFPELDQKEYTYECNLFEFDLDSAITQLPSDMFPYVVQGSGRSRIFKAYSMNFQLTHQVPLVPMTNYEIPWLQADQFSEMNGNFVTYIRNGYEKSMQNPYIMVQYLNKSLPSVSQVDSIFLWLDSKFLPLQGAEVLKDIYEVKTISGKVAKVKEYKYPKQEQRAGKTLAYAYIDYDEEFIIGFALTTVNDSDYPLNQPLFIELVKSFCS